MRCCTRGSAGRGAGGPPGAAAGGAPAGGCGAGAGACAAASMDPASRAASTPTRAMENEAMVFFSLLVAGIPPREIITAPLPQNRAGPR
nr:MAG: hypothetical protein DIU62_09840 [Pseudomonadota bacterium]